MSETESFEALWEFCTANKRVVPMPMRWRKLYQMLRGTRELPTGEWEPPLPLIKHAWNDTKPEAKQHCFQQQIRWAADQGQISEVGQFLRELSEEEWYHFPEL